MHNFFALAIKLLFGACFKVCCTLQCELISVRPTLPTLQWHSQSSKEGLAMNFAIKEIKAEFAVNPCNTFLMLLRP